MLNLLDTHPRIQGQSQLHKDCICSRDTQQMKERSWCSWEQATCWMSFSWWGLKKGEHLDSRASNGLNWPLSELVRLKKDWIYLSAAEASQYGRQTLILARHSGQPEVEAHSPASAQPLIENRPLLLPPLAPHHTTKAKPVLTYNSSAMVKEYSRWGSLF